MKGFLSYTFEGWTRCVDYPQNDGPIAEMTYNATQKNAMLED